MGSCLVRRGYMQEECFLIIGRLGVSFVREILVNDSDYIGIVNKFCC
jgi:hypothetical protein